MKYVIVIGCLISASFFLACNKSEEPVAKEPEVKVVKKVWTDDNTKSSELAQLMRKMVDDNAVIRKKLMAGEYIDSFPKSYYTIHTAEATTPSDINDIYHSFADIYLNSLEDFVDPEKESQIEAFNNVVQNCVACHNTFCQGPIPRIEKLYIKE